MSTATKGSFVPVEGHDDWWEVSTGGGTYIVNQETGECSCPAWEWRCSKTPGSTCKHGDALAAFLDEQKYCATCSGNGVVKLRCQYPGPDPICLACFGTGMRQPEPLPDDANLRDLFR